jgi:hypothetical protein
MLGTLLLPALAAAQTPSPRFEINGSVAATRVFRVEDQSFGTVVNPGVGLEWRVMPKLGLNIEMNRVAGLEPRIVNCRAFFPGVSCSGTGREGVLNVALMSVTAAWYFGDTGSVQAYVLGGMDIMWSRTVSSVVFGGGDVRPISELEQRDRGTGITGGVGVRVPIGSHLVVKPEWRIYDGTLMSRANLSAMRTSVAIGYRW